MPNEPNPFCPGMCFGEKLRFKNHNSNYSSHKKNFVKLNSPKSSFLKDYKKYNQFLLKIIFLSMSFRTSLQKELQKHTYLTVKGKNYNDCYK